MRGTLRSDAGMTLVETLIAMLVLTIGALGMAQAFLYGMSSVSTGPNELIATQKAGEAIESVFSARDTKTLTWAQLRNVSAGGVFLDGAQQIKTSGADGIVDTTDDGAVETVVLPGPDQQLGTADDIQQSLTNFKRQIQITDQSDTIRVVTVTITFPAGPTTRTYAVTVYMSSFS
jgi:prepilin-type N-terminal cleavage/methylation domain-containing protein